MDSDYVHELPTISWKVTQSNAFNPFDSLAEEILVSWTIDDPVILIKAQKAGISLAHRVPNHILHHLDPNMDYIEVARKILEIRTRSNPFLKHPDLQKLVDFLGDLGCKNCHQSKTISDIPDIFLSNAVFDTPPVIPYLGMEYCCEEFWNDVKNLLLNLEHLTNQEIAVSVFHLFIAMVSLKTLKEVVVLGKSSYSINRKIKHWRKHQETILTNEQICLMIFDEIIKQVSEPTGFSSDLSKLPEILYLEIINFYNDWAIKAFKLEAIIKSSKTPQEPLSMEFFQYSLWKIIGSLYYNKSLDEYLAHIGYLLEYLGHSEHHKRLISLKKVFGSDSSMLSLASDVLFSNHRTEVDDSVLRKMNISSSKEIPLAPEFLEVLNICYYDDERLLVNESTLKKIPALIAYLAQEDETIDGLNEDLKILRAENELLKQKLAKIGKELSGAISIVSYREEKADLHKELLQLQEKSSVTEELNARLLAEREHLTDIIRQYEEEIRSKDSETFEPFDLPVKVNYFGFEDRLVSRLAKYNILLKILDPTKPVRNLPESHFTFMNVSRATHSTWYSLKSHGVNPNIVASNNTAILEKLLVSTINKNRANEKTTNREEDVNGKT